MPKTITIDANSKITLGTLGVFISMLLGGIWWAASIDKGVSRAIQLGEESNKTIADLSQTVQGLSQNQQVNTSDIQTLEEMHAEMKKRMSAMESKQDRNSELLVRIDTKIEMLLGGRGNNAELSD